MTVSSKPPLANVARLMVYQRPLHPELFTLHARRSDTHGDYEVESWLLRGGHSVRFNSDGKVLTETVVDAASSDNFPEGGLLHAMPCVGEKEFEIAAGEELGYCASLQVEQLSDNLFDCTYRELLDFADETGSLVHEWDDDNGRNLSLLDAQKYRDQYHFQSYHLSSDQGQVLRTQSIFEVAAG
ncbi:MAG: DUF2617 family protein [Planctomycetota bacterium]